MTFRKPTEQELLLSDQEYLVTHNIQDLMAGMLREIVVTKPMDPIQYMVDHMVLGAEQATQDALGLSHYRRSKLMAIFGQMDKNGSGAVDFKEIKAHSSKNGGQALTEEELREVFRDFDTSGDHQIDSAEFLAFFSRSVKALSNAEFDIMAAEMMD
uniref:EF-hand domain-containing protein n=1 Tax=Mantoniella antarctica TaxID=81844 RepID=A0A7S0SFB3_9CHLO|mmetsp:Transcript_4952/g.7711  ORF Transcript_4952/g.7711 Transcript_4952/m.7711 type:complete len:156 (+) Transcript_4952:280-747(+)|eukprot:CAMPEP_0181361446 /NCGR_PEP_ID=MMETSP1106-20121128/7303_1 /TAXON_ID=81844 /ORGANISM="Mantoniella antarctica, Strain SL-175" /LENGTH=155 /DNA_ID=CAMNT_0023474985 /DNA_START=253 /DNA_END=720 /DNA_ORIENTATION=+